MSRGEREASYWRKEANNAVRCGLCPHHCQIQDGASGICKVRINEEGTLVAAGYGRVSSIALDPIEKKPLYMFHRGKTVLSIGGYGCNMKCGFCQNFEISAEYGDIRSITRQISPDEVVTLATETMPKGNIGVAYTYNEPLIGYEFLSDCAALVKEAGLCNVLVTNGLINREPLENLLPLIDAMNIDLKGFSDGFYKSIGGDLETAKETIALAAENCHIEVTTLVIPAARSEQISDGAPRGGGFDDPLSDGNEGDVEAIAKWLSTIDPNIPLHLSRFFPRYRMSEIPPTPRETILRLQETAKKHLKNVFAGNMF